MIAIPLAAIPNQSFTITLDGVRYGITIKEALGIMVSSIERDGVSITRAQKCAAGTPLLPYNHQMDGNFIFVTVNGEDPFYTEFSSTQSLVYLSQAEIDAL